MAVKKFRENPGKYLLDLHMPAMDGYEAAKIIRSLNFDIPITALTANAFQEDIDKCIALGTTILSSPSISAIS